MQNFREAAALLLQAGAARQVPDAARLVPALRQLLADGEARRRLGEAAWHAVSAHQGACERTLEALERLLEPGTSADEDREAATP
jgi:3-deoxy-D-manno-octulosonic-acid transferase